MSEDDRALLQEIVDRSRRTETRVTKIANHIGVSAGEEKPRYEAAKRRVHITSRRSAIDDVMAVVPLEDRCPKGVDVFCGADYLMSLAWP